MSMPASAISPSSATKSIGKDKGSVGVALGAEAKDGELGHEPLGPVDRGAGFLADLEPLRQRSLGRLTAGTTAQMAGAVGDILQRRFRYVTALTQLQLLRALPFESNVPDRANFF